MLQIHRTNDTIVDASNSSWNPFSSSSSSSSKASGPWGECDGWNKGWNHCIVNGIMCVTQCGMTHMTLDGLCSTSGQGISTDGECPSGYSCEMTASDVMKMQKMSSIFQSS